VETSYEVCRLRGGRDGERRPFCLLGQQGDFGVDGEEAVFYIWGGEGCVAACVVLSQ
jgi:hypothetical protein